MGLLDAGWHMAALPVADKDAIAVLQAAADHLEQRIGQYNPQNVCNILWTYATLGYYPGGSPLDVAADYALHALEVSLALQLLSLSPV